MINVYHSIITYEGNEFEDYLKKIHIFSIFQKLFEEFETEVAFKILKFILYGYSMDSDMLLMQGNNWIKVSKHIYETVGLEPEFEEDVLQLKNDSVQICIQKWLSFQNDENFTNYITFRDLRKQMLISSLSDIKTANGTEINYEQKMKNAIHAQTLHQMMNEALETFIQNHSKLKSSIEAFNRASEKNKVTKSVGSYAL